MPRAYLSPCGRESVFLCLRAGLSPSKCLENAREGIAKRGYSWPTFPANSLIQLTFAFFWIAIYPTTRPVADNPRIALAGTRMRTGHSGRAAVSGSVAQR